MATLSPADRTRIETAITAAERRTGAELAVVVAQASDDYAGFPLLWAGVAALLIGGALAVVRPVLPSLILFGTEAVVFLLVGVALAALPSRARLAPPAVREARSRAMAELQFSARVAGRTSDAAGLLLFVSLAEHFAAVRVDRRVAAAIPDATWSVIVAELVRAARAGRLADGIIAALDACAAALAQPFPPTAEQVDEIPNQVAEV